MSGARLVVTSVLIGLGSMPFFYLAIVGLRDVLERRAARRRHGRRGGYIDGGGVPGER